MIIAVEKWTHKELIKSVLRKTILARNPKDRIPCPIAIYGRPGTGKSSLALYWAEVLGKMICKDENEFNDWIDHVIKEHIAYSAGDADTVIKHLAQCKNAPVAIFMEAREALESRRSMSDINVILTRAIAVLRRLNPSLLLFCIQKLNEIDVRVREQFRLVARCVKYIDSKGYSRRPYVVYYSVKKRLTESFDETMYLERALILCKNGKEPELLRCGKVYWSLPKCYEKFDEVDRQKKMEIVGAIEQESHEVKSSETRGPLDKIDKEDGFDLFVTSSITYDPNSRVSMMDVYRAYVEFCSKYSIDCYDALTFEEKLKERFLIIPDRSYWIGIQLKNNASAHNHRYRHTKRN